MEDKAEKWKYTYNKEVSSVFYSMHDTDKTSEWGRGFIA